MHTSLLSGARTVMTKMDTVALRAAPHAKAGRVAVLRRGVVGRLGTCACGYCEVTTHGLRGWVRTSALWGLHPRETRTANCRDNPPVASRLDGLLEGLSGVADLEANTGGS